MTRFNCCFLVLVVIIAIGLLCLPVFCTSTQSIVQADPPTDNIVGAFEVKTNHYYSNKTTVLWGHNSEKLWNVTVSLSPSMATYNCSNTTSYECSDPTWMYDWNKLWGKARCGYMHDHHQASDRFVWRRYDNKCWNKVELFNSREPFQKKTTTF